MTLDERSSSEKVVLVLRGEYDIAAREALREAFGAVNDAHRLVLDLSAVTYVNSSVIEELVTLHAGRASAGLESEILVLANANLMRILEVLDLTRHFRIHASLDEALERDGEAFVVQYVNGDQAL